MGLIVFHGHGQNRGPAESTSSSFAMTREVSAVIRVSRSASAARASFRRFPSSRFIDPTSCV